MAEDETVEDVYCVEEGYIVNYYLDSIKYKKASKSLDKEGNVISENEWYSPTGAELEDIHKGVVAIVDSIEDEDGVAYANLLKKDDKGNYYIIEYRKVTIEGEDDFYEKYICKYNTEGERVEYAIYDYSKVGDIKFIEFDKNIIMDEKNNIYVVEFSKDELIVKRIELGQDDEELHEERLAEYVDSCMHYKTDGDIEGDGVTWLEIKNECEYPADMDNYAKVTDTAQGFIMKTDNDEIIVEPVYRVETYPYDVNDYYVMYSKEKVTYKLAEDVEVWACYQYPYQYGIIETEDIENFEITYANNRKIEWVLHLNAQGEVQYIFQPYEP